MVPTVANDAPGSSDPLPSGKMQSRRPWRWLLIPLIRIAERQRPRLTALQRPLVDVATAAPIARRAVVIVKFDDEIVAGAIAEGDGPRRGLVRLRGRAGARGQVLMGVLGPGAGPETTQSANRQDHRNDL